MRICLVSEEYPPETGHGGIGTQTWNKAQALTELGHSVEVLSRAGIGEAARTCEEAGITVHRMAPPGAAPACRLPIYDQSVYMIGYTWSVLHSLHKLTQENQFDLINLPEYGAEGFAFQANRTAANWVPTIVQLHAPLAMLAERMGWPEKNTSFYRTATFMEGESIRLADGWMASSANIATFVAEFYGIPRSEIEVVHCGVDCDMFRPGDAEGRRNERPTVLFVGNVTPSKGISTVFEAILRLRTRFPNILLQVVGKGDELWNEMINRARRDGAEGNLERIPFVKERAEISEIYRRAHVFASPADHENGVANAYVEAMACGCPVIASTTGGASEAVTDGESGFLVPPRDVEATTAAIEQVLGNEALRRHMGAAGRRRAENYFAREHYINRVLAAYQKTINRSQEKLASLKTRNG